MDLSVGGMTAPAVSAQRARRAEVAASAGRRVWPVVPPDEWGKDLKDRAHELISMAVNEAGYTPSTWWDGPAGVWMCELGMDERVLDKARTLVYPVLGIEFVVADQPPWASS